MELTDIGMKATLAARLMRTVNTKQKNEFLLKLADNLEDYQDEILNANSIDIDKGRQGHMSDALIDRLLINEKRIIDMAEDLRTLACHDDPVGKVIDEKVLENGLQLQRQRTPLGVIAVIYEARPNVTIDISGLAIKASNAVILRGGKETINTNQTLVDIIQKSLSDSGLPQDAVQYINDPDRKLVRELVKLDAYIDLLVPRGGNRLQQFCKQEATMPVMTGGIGICHLFVDESADLDLSLSVIENAKVQRPSVCNALDTLLIHKDIASPFIKAVIERLVPLGVTIKLEEEVLKTMGINEMEHIEVAMPSDFDREWLSLTLGVKIVDNLDEAVDHILAHSSMHSDGILTSSQKHADIFISQVDSAVVYVNASTRFTDGAQFGLGGEVAVSTQKMHARGPVGLDGLTTYKWIVKGSYQIRN